ncbi:hypothetical protein BH20ACT4_BH20ACT4_03940 [soil metagenome]
MRQQGTGGWRSSLGRLASERPRSSRRSRRRDGLGASLSGGAPGGEQFADAVDRVGDAITALGASRTPTLVISHGGAIRAAVTWVTGLERGRLTPVRPASVTVLDVTGRTIITYGATTSLSSVLTRPSSDAL